MTTRLMALGLVATVCTHLRGEDVALRERAIDVAKEAPPVRAVWLERSTGADLFSPRIAASPVLVEAGGPVRGASIDFNPPFVLIEVRAEGGVLRLVGHTGAGRSLRGIFALPGGGSVLARAGEPVGAEGLTVRAMELRRVRVEGETVRRARAFLVRDVNGEIVTLDAAGNSGNTVGLLAVFRTISGGTTTEVRAGDQLQWDDRIYRVGRIVLQPPAVEIRWADDAGAEHRVDLEPPDATGRSDP